MTSDESSGALGATEGSTNRFDERRHSLTRNMVAMMSSQVVSWLLGVVAQIVQPRFLGPEGLGQIQLAFSLWLVASVFVSLGTNVYLTLETAKDRSRGVALVGPILTIRVVTFAVASLGMAIYAQIVGLDRTMIQLLIITGIAMLVNAAQEVFAAAIVGMEQMSYVSIAVVTSKLVYTVAMVVVLAMGGGVVGLAWTTVLNAALAIAMLLYFYLRLAAITFPRPSRRHLGIIAASAGFMLSGVALVVYQQIDMVVLSLLVDDAALGWYSSADILVSSIGFVPSLIIVVLFPMIGRLHESDAPAVARIVRRAFIVLVLLGVSFGLGLSVISEPFAVLLFGEDFRETGEVLAVYGLAIPLIFLTMLFGLVALATGREGFWNKIMIIAIVASVGFDIAFVPVFDRYTGNGAIAGALGYVLTELFMVIAGAKRIAPELLSATWLARVSKVLVAGALMFVAANPFREQFLLIPILIGIVVFVAAVLLFRILTADEIELFHRLAQRVGIPVRSKHLATTGPDQAEPLVAPDHEPHPLAGPDQDTTPEQSE